MKNSRTPKSGCFSTVLRRLLCSGGPQTHPSDQISDLYQTDDFASDEKTEMLPAQMSAPPGIVARLMGLDSFPKNKGSVSEDSARVSRSKSVNFIDYLLEFDVTGEAKHRRFRTSVSFREVPNSKDSLGGQELLLIYLENNGAGKQSTAELIKQSKCEEEKVLKKEEKKNNKISKLKDEPRSRRRRGRISKEKMEKRKGEMSRLGRRKRKEIVGGRTECCEHTPSDDVRYQESNSKKQWSGKVGSCNSAKSVKEETDSLVESLGNLSKLTEEDIIKSENWAREMSEVNGEELEEICGGLEGQILQVMLDQVADELLGIW